MDIFGSSTSQFIHTLLALPVHSQQSCQGERVHLHSRNWPSHLTSSPHGSACPPARTLACKPHMAVCLLPGKLLSVQWSGEDSPPARQQSGWAQLFTAPWFRRGSLRQEPAEQVLGPRERQCLHGGDAIGGRSQTQSNRITVSKNTRLPLRETTCNNSHAIGRLEFISRAN